MANHTPGPWRQEAPYSLLVVSGEGKSKHDIVAGCWGHSDQRYAEGVANARLVAAAPELLAALTAQQCFECGQRIEASEGRGEPCVVCAPAVAAVAKAEGRTDGR